MSCGVSSCSVLPAGLQSGGGCGCSSGRNSRGLFGGLVGGGKVYCATRRNLQMLRKYKRGVSIGFTGRSSLLAKGLLPRGSEKYKGKYVLGPKYSGTRRNRVLRRQTKKCKRV